METMIRLSGVTKSYRRAGETLRVLDHLDLEVESGRFLALMGPSGSGKTTLLNLVGGLDHADSGEVIVAGRSLDGLEGAELSRWRAETVGFVFQQFNLLSVLTAQENVELPLLLAPLSRKRRRDQARHALDLVGLGDRLHHRPGQLSGGQEQRVAIARAIATDPQVILADEPTGDLDRASADQVLELLDRLHRELGKTVIVVTHDPLAAKRSERIVHLDKGKLVRTEDARA